MNKFNVLLMFHLFSLCLSCSTNAMNGSYVIERVVDGDTVVLSNLGKVRLIGVDTPETVDPRKPVQFFGKEASAYLNSIALGKTVTIEFDQSVRDRYRRVLGYLYLTDGTLLNAKIIEEGYGFAYTKYPFKKMDEFRNLEREARTKGKGLWGGNIKTTAQKSPPLSPTPVRATYQCAYKTCKQMASCEEARFLLDTCGLKKLDRDKDGVPCENICR